MATLALGVGGAALFGSFATGGAATLIGAGITAGQLGFALGSLAGSVIDSMLFAPDTPSPKLPEQRVQGFAYGADIKQVLGTDRVAGTLLWVRANRIDQQRAGNGAGGPFGKAAAPDRIERTITCRVGICRGPVDGVIAIWANGKPIYDVRSDPTTGNPGVFRADGVDFTIYRGTGNEVPDPDEEADRGAGNTPAYRHWASIVFRNLPLGASAQVPQFEFLVAAETGIAASGLQKTIYSGPLVAGLGGTGGWSYDPHSHALWLGTSELLSGELVKLNLYTDEISDSVGHAELGITDTEPKGAGGGAVTYFTHGPITGGDIRPSVYLLQKGAQPAFPAGIDRAYEIDHVSVRVTRIFDSTVLSHDRGTVARAGDTDYLVLTSRSETGSSFPRLVVIDLETGLVVGSFSQAHPVENAVMRGHDLFAIVHEETARVMLERFTLVPNATSPEEGVIRTGRKTQLTSGTGNPPTAMGYLPDEDVVIVVGIDVFANPGNLGFYDVSGGTPERLPADDAITTAQYADHQHPALRSGVHEGTLWLLRADGHTVDKIGVADRILLDQFDLSSLSITAEEVCHEARGNSLIVRDGSKLKRVFLDRIATSPVGLGPAILSIGAAAGLSPVDFDVSELSGLELDGLTLNAQAPARRWIEILMRAFYLSAVETSGRIRFRRLDEAVDSAVAPDDLGAAENGGEDVKLRLTRLPDTELPKLVEIGYRDRDENHEPAVQTADHPVFAGTRKSTITIDAVLDRDRAKRLAVAMLYQAHAEREKVNFALPWNRLDVEPGDVLSVPHNGRLLNLRVTRTGIGAVVECEAVPAVNLFDGVETGAEPALPGPGVRSLADTELFLFDIPFLRDGDAAFEAEGIYVGTAPSEASLDWSGAVVSRTSGGSSQGEVARIFGNAAWGALVMPPPDPEYPGWQRAELTLRLVAGSLSSTTLAGLLLEQENLALIASGDPFAGSGPGGWEAIQFLTATDHGDGSWSLGGRLLRGVRGTDPFMRHAPGDRIAIVDAAELERVVHPRDAAFTYAAATIGKNTGGFARASDEERLRSRGHSQKCWAPRLVRGTRNGSGDLTLSWSRRARLGGELTDGSGAALLESAEVYEIDILDGPGGSVVRTIDSGITPGGPADPWSARVTYSAGDQATDGLTPGAPVNVRVYQVGAVGRGFALERAV